MLRRRKLHNEELHDLYSSQSIIKMIKLRRIRWAEHVAGMREKRNAYKVLVGKPEGKRSPRKTRCGWVDNIKMDLGEMGLDSVVWIGRARDRTRWRAIVNAVINLKVP
jgi:hypothetical protein